jgi:hypothetical protein
MSRTAGVQLPEGARAFSFLHRVHTISVTYQSHLLAACVLPYLFANQDYKMYFINMHSWKKKKNIYIVHMTSKVMAFQS